jgi:predicted RNA methylase
MNAYKDMTTVFAFVLDYERTNAYNKFLKEHAKDKVICDIGTGTGVLSYLASVHGARKIYSYEKKKSVFNFASSVLGSIENINLFHGDATKVIFPKDIDFFVHELFGNLVFEENIEGVLENIKRQYSKPLVYPSDIEVYKFVDSTAHNSLLDNTSYDTEVVDYIQLLEEYGMNKKDSTPRLNTKKEIALELIKRFNLCTDDLIEVKKFLPGKFYWKAQLDKYSFGNYPRATNNWF